VAQFTSAELIFVQVGLLSHQYDFGKGVW